MNSCPSRDGLRAFVEGNVTDTEGDDLIQHLTQCSTCRAVTEQLSAGDLLLDMQRRSIEAQDAPNASTLDCLREKLHAWPDILDNPMVSRGSDISPPSQSRILGRYELREVLGIGGFGVVYRADDTQLNRSVAIKLPRHGMMDDPDSRRRYIQEVRVAANLHHPHIVALYDAGEIDGVWFLASAFIEGPTLARWISKEKDVAPRTAAQIVLALASAVQHAHEQGVLHRDIKPQNVLLDPSGSIGELGFSPKLTDFGVAKLLGLDGEQTLTGHLVGTPRYMAPELVSGKRNALGPACDIFSLGVVLYELLTGTAPFKGATNMEVLRRVTDDEPTSPCRLRRQVPLDLDAICMRCLEKDPHRRYATAGDLAGDIARFLKQLPTVARPVSGTERVFRWIRRRPAIASLIGVSFFATILLIVGLTVHSRRLGELNDELSYTNQAWKKAAEDARLAETRALRSETDTAQLLYVTDMRLAGKAWRDGDLRGVVELLERHKPINEEFDRRGLEWYFLAKRAYLAPNVVDRAPSDVYQICLDHQQRRLAAVGKDAMVRLYDAESGELEMAFSTGQVEVNGVDFSSDGRTLATAGDDGTIRVWSLNDQSLLRTIEAHAEVAYHVRFMNDDRQLLSCGKEREVRIWDLASGMPLGVYSGNERNVEAIDVGGDFVASAGQDSVIRVWHRSENRLLHEWKGGNKESAALCVSISPDRKLLAAGGPRGQVRIWSLITGKLLGIGEHLTAVQSIAFSSDSRNIASGDVDGTVGLWDLREILDRAGHNGEPDAISLVRKWQAHRGTAYSLVWKNSHALLSAGADGEILCWNDSILTTTVESHEFLNGFGDLAFTANSSMLVRHRSELLTLQLPYDRQRDSHSASTNYKQVASSQDGTTIATLSEEGALECWDAATHKSPCGRLDLRLSCTNLDDLHDVRKIRISPDGKAVAILNAGSAPRICVFATGDGGKIGQLMLAKGSLGKLSFSPSGSLLAANVDDDVFVWRLGANQGDEPLELADERVLRIEKAQNSVQAVAFSPDELLLATSGVDRTIRFWNPQTGELITTLYGHRGGIRGLVFSPDGRTLLSSGDDGAIKAWNVESRSELFDLVQSDQQQCGDLYLSPGGRWLAAWRNTNKQLLILDLH